MIPEFNEDGLLPPGIHRATLEEFKERFVIFNRSDRRLRVFEGLNQLIQEAARSNIVQQILIGGSFVTAKAEPNEFDCLVVVKSGLERTKVNPFEYRLISRPMARRLFRGDVVPVSEGSSVDGEYLEFFQHTREGERVGIVEIEL